MADKITEDEPGEQAERLTVSGGKLRDPSVVDIAGTSYLYALFEDDDGTASLDRRALEEGPIDHDLPAEREVTDRLSLEVRRATSAADRETYRSLFSRSTGLGLSVSFDGVEWSVNPYNPVVSGTPTLGSASQIRFQAQYLIYTEAGRGPLRILAAVNQSGHPSLSWPLLSELAPPPSDSPR